MRGLREIIIGLSLSACTHSSAMQQLETRYRDATIHTSQRHTDDLVVIIPDVHNYPQCQNKVYHTLMDLKPNLKFVAVEGEWETTSEHYFPDYPLVPTKVESTNTTFNIGGYATFESLNKKSYEERVTFAEQNTTDGWFLSRDALKSKPVSGPVLYQLVNHDISLYPIEDKDLLDESGEAKDDFDAQKITWAEYYYKAVIKRNPSFVKNLKLRMEENKDMEGHLVALTIGRGHMRGVENLLRMEGISYITILHDECKPKRQR